MEQVTTSSNYERLQEWGCYAKPERLPARYPDGRYNRTWHLHGADFHDDCELYEHTFDQLVACVNSFDPSDFEIDPRLLHEHLDPYGSYGWGFNVKLHGIWSCFKVWERQFPEIADIDDMEDMYWEWSIDDAWENLWEWIDYHFDELDRKKFEHHGRSGGWLVYTRHDLSLEEADALRRLNEELPDFISGVCKDFAAKEAGHRLAKLLEQDFEMAYDDTVELSGNTFQVKYV